jgi:hypothetical protein
MKRKGQMHMKYHSILGGLITAALITAVPALYAQAAAGGFKSEPDKSMAAAHDSFKKGEKAKAAADIDKATEWVKEQGDKVAEGSKAGMKAAGEDLAKLGDGIKKGTVKSGDEMKKTFAKVDHQIASCWHKTAEDSKKAGKDSTDALNKAGVALENSAKWSGHQLSEGTRASVAAVKRAGKATGEGAKSGAEAVDKWFKGIGDGIDELGKKL